MRSRAGRLYAFSSLSEVDETLDVLQSRPDGPFVVRLSPELGKREARYAHLLSGSVKVASVLPDSDDINKTPIQNDDHEKRILALEEELAQLYDDIKLLKQAFDL